MSRKVPKIKGIHENSQIKAIGNVFRLIDGSEWNVNVQLEPDHHKQSLGISQIPFLARRRILNATEQPRAAGYQKVFTLNNVAWQAVKIKHCPVQGVAQRQDKEQWCFQFQQDGVKVYLPQLELARALFLHEPYLCRLAMNPGGIAEEFEIQHLDDSDSIQINLLESCSLPKHIRGHHGLRRALASVILDPQMRRAFESISKKQIEDGQDIGRHRVWQFRFDPPPLEQVLLTVRGHFDQAKSAMFVYEIYGLEGLPCNHAHNVNFFDPDYKRQTPGNRTATSVSPVSYPEVEVDDNEIPLVAEAKEWVLESPQVIRSYIDPANTTRNGKGTLRPYAGHKEVESNGEKDVEVLDVSTDEGSRKGHVPCAGIDGLDDQSDDVHNYTGRFQIFAAMIEMLQDKGCKENYSELRKLPAVVGRSKHLLDDGTPRLWSIYLLNLNGIQFALMEVDTFGNRNQLSTLLVRQPKEKFDWNAAFPEIERRVVQESLKWPTKYLNVTFPADAVQRISHPQTPSENKALLEADSIKHWADRVFARMQ